MYFVNGNIFFIRFAVWYVKVNLSLCFYIRRHEDVWKNGDNAPSILKARQ